MDPGSQRALHPGYHHWQVSDAKDSGIYQDVEYVVKGMTYTFGIYIKFGQAQKPSQNARTVELRLESIVEGQPQAVASKRTSGRPYRGSVAEADRFRHPRCRHIARAGNHRSGRLKMGPAGERFGWTRGSSNDDLESQLNRNIINVSRRAFGLIAGVMASALICSANAQTPDPFLAANGINIRNGMAAANCPPARCEPGCLAAYGRMDVPSGFLRAPRRITRSFRPLTPRFGVSTEQSLIRGHTSSTWITTNDLDNIRALGITGSGSVWWGDVQTLSGTWRADAFDRMDWGRQQCLAAGIYTLMTSTSPRRQSTSQSTGQQNQNLIGRARVTSPNGTHLVECGCALRRHPAVAGYDLMNDLPARPSQLAIWAMYSNLYQTAPQLIPITFV